MTEWDERTTEVASPDTNIDLLEISPQSTTTGIPAWISELRDRSEFVGPVFEQELATHGYYPVADMGRGKEGKVFLAWSESHNRLVAIKEARTFDPEFQTHRPEDGRKLKEEYEILNVVRARLEDSQPISHRTKLSTPLDLIEEKFGTYLVLEAVISLSPSGIHESSEIKARTFADFIAEGYLNEKDKLLGVLRGVNTFVNLCQTVQALHEQGVVHRDLKPENVLIDGDNTPVIIDFGAARTSGTIPRSSDVGASGYKAPETNLGEPLTVSPQLDIYSLGCLLYKTLTGITPYSDAKSNSDQSITFASIVRDPTHPQTLNPTAPERLCDICLKAMARDPYDRYEGVGEMLLDLEGYLKSL